MSINKHKWLVLAIDEFRCIYCGRGASEGFLHVDHLVPRTRPLSEKKKTLVNERDSLENLVTACGVCNHGKCNLLLPDEAIQRIRDIRLPKIKKMMELNNRKDMYLYRSHGTVKHKLPNFFPLRYPVDMASIDFLTWVWDSRISKDNQYQLTPAWLERIFVWWWDSLMLPVYVKPILIAEYFQQTKATDDSIPSSLCYPGTIRDIIASLRKYTNEYFSIPEITSRYGTRSGEYR